MIDIVPENELKKINKADMIKISEILNVKESKILDIETLMLE